METNGGGWTVLQRRVDGSVDFYRYWNDYKNGFGNLNFEFWLGLSKIHRLIKARQFTELLINLTDFEGNIVHARYSYFNIGDSSTNYTLTVSGYSGTAKDAMTNSNNMKFTTRDDDNDVQYGSNCATSTEGAWWYNECSICTDANLNGVYHDSAVTGSNTVSWYPWKNKESLRLVEIKIRPTQLQPPPPPPTIAPSKIIGFYDYYHFILVRKDCKEFKEEGSNTSGIYTINPDGGEPFKVSYCTIY